MRIELVEMEQVLNILQLLVAKGMPEARPSEVDPDEYAEWPHHRVDMVQACQNPTCCAHGHHVAQPSRIDDVGAHEP